MLEIYRVREAGVTKSPYLDFLALHQRLSGLSVQLALQALEPHQTLGAHMAPEVPGPPGLAAQGHQAHLLGHGSLQGKITVRLRDS